MSDRTTSLTDNPIDVITALPHGWCWRAHGASKALPAVAVGVAMVDDEPATSVLVAPDGGSPGWVDAEDGSLERLTR